MRGIIADFSGSAAHLLLIDAAVPVWSLGKPIGQQHLLVAAVADWAVRHVDAVAGTHARGRRTVDRQSGADLVLPQQQGTSHRAGGDRLE